MDNSTLLFFVVALVYVGAIIYLSNQHELERTRQPAGANSLGEVVNRQRETWLRWLLYGAVALNFLLNLLIFQTALSSDLMETLPPEAQLPPINTTAALANLVLGAAISLVSFRIISSPTARQRLQRVLGGRSLYNPDSAMHIVAVVLSLVLLSTTISQLVFSSELSTSPGDALFQGLIWLALAFLGVGLSVRRPLAQTLTRLGLRWPKRADWLWGIGAGFALWLILILLSAIWARLVPPEQIQEQMEAAEKVSRAFATPALALLLALISSVSEEILFRGALQPVFGLWPTSIFFTLLHMQYAFTPASLILLVISLGLGWVRQRQSTTASIFAHFVYNFIIQFLVVLQVGGGSF
ncbi:MAG TPA: type II CAAX endopeptidase family protein [Phototrophicaceae bacterium]|nr:type II CAAX endopeptidase family protein [Phototrophicaceae bacterium]